jgi:hypothetical protein
MQRILETRDAGFIFIDKKNNLFQVFRSRFDENNNFLPDARHANI